VECLLTAQSCLPRSWFLLLNVSSKTIAVRESLCLMGHHMFDLTTAIRAVFLTSWSCVVQHLALALPELLQVGSSSRLAPDLLSSHVYTPKHRNMIPDPDGAMKHSVMLLPTFTSMFSSVGIQVVCVAFPLVPLNKFPCVLLYICMVLTLEV
jgi:hypothetical protein